MVKKSITRLTGYFFLILFLGFFASTTFFNHTHIVDGDTIVHSHPYKKDKNGNPTHQHSTKGYLLIHIIKNFTTTAVASTLFGTILVKSIHEIPSGKSSSIVHQLPLSPNIFRGPPVRIF
jgi:hypothetical protein